MAPIDRSGFSIWVDDDGSRTTGTVLTKERWEEDILDPIDAAIVDGPSTPAAHAVTHRPGGSDEVTIDDVDTWTPAWTGAGGASGTTYTIAEGTAIKTGRLVTAFGHLTIGTLGTISGQLQLSGLPYTAANVTNPGSLRVTMGANLATNVVELSGIVIGNTTKLNMWKKTGAATSATAMAGSDLQAGTEAYVQVTYQAAT